MAKKLEKSIEGNVVKITYGGEEKNFDFTKLPQEIQTKFGPFGLGHKLGDSAAGKDGVEVFASIEKVWEGLMKGDWSVRAPAGDKVSINSLLSSVEEMAGSEAEKARLKTLLNTIMAAKKAEKTAKK